MRSTSRACPPPKRDGKGPWTSPYYQHLGKTPYVGRSAEVNEVQPAAVSHAGVAASLDPVSCPEGALTGGSSTILPLAAREPLTA